MTIFGFNTDIRSGDTVYHVQTEAHESECLMQTAVFVRGRCIGKYSSSYANEAEQPGFSEQAHELLKQQHRFVLSSIRECRLETLLNSAGAGRAEYPAPQPDTAPATVAEPSGVAASAISEEGEPNALVSGLSGFDSSPSHSPKPLAIEIISSHIHSTAPELLMRLRILWGTAAAEGAKVIARLDVSGSAPTYSQAVSDCEGEAQAQFAIGTSSQSPDVPLTVLVQAVHNGQYATKRFKLRRTQD